jgi:hypothetical protein
MPTPGDTLDSVADKFGLPPLLLLAANPQVPSLTDPLPPDNPVIIPDLPPNSNGEPPAGVPQIPPNLYPYGLGPRPAPMRQAGSPSGLIPILGPVAARQRFRLRQNWWVGRKTAAPA